MDVLDKLKTLVKTNPNKFKNVEGEGVDSIYIDINGETFSRLIVFTKEGKKEISIDCPDISIEYNFPEIIIMSGVDFLVDNIDLILDEFRGYEGGSRLNHIHPKTNIYLRDKEKSNYITGNNSVYKTIFHEDGTKEWVESFDLQYSNNLSRICDYITFIGVNGKFKGGNCIGYEFEIKISLPEGKGTSNYPDYLYKFPWYMAEMEEISDTNTQLKYVGSVKSMDDVKSLVRKFFT